VIATERSASASKNAVIRSGALAAYGFMEGHMVDGLDEPRGREVLLNLIEFCLEG
jgi:hypothetical protein